MATILIIEDDVDINNIIYEMLNNEHFQCTQAYSGSEGKLIISSQEFDLIILDLMLPGLSGEDFLHHIRNNIASDTPLLSCQQRRNLIINYIYLS
nr:response regulator [Bacillus sp. JCM 19034]